MPDSPEKIYQQLCDHVRQTAMILSIQHVLAWDERTTMPPAAGQYRAEQITYLAGIVHERQTDPRVGEWLDALADSPLATDPHSDTGATIRTLRRRYDRKVKLPQTLVEELTRTAVLGQQVWATARKNNDFAALCPLLEKTFELKRQEAEAVGYDEHPYDALLDDYEPAETTANVARLLASLRHRLVPLVEAVAQSRRRPPVDVLHRHYPIASQEAFVNKIAERIGFDFQSGRLAVSQHPFCMRMGPSDTRMTTRYDEKHFNSAFFGTLHEAGHAIYDQGRRADQFGLPPGEYISLGIHESQSRMWENLVGRSLAFWEGIFPEAQEAFPEALGDVAVDDFYFAVNDVRPSLIRVEADEATYNLHILVRFELEQALIDGELAVNDLPVAWNDKYEAYLGIRPDDDTHGVLQDIHWSAGLVGYFPTYTLGNMYASQFYAAARDELGDLAPAFRSGKFAPLRAWLREKIHVRGKTFTAAELVRDVTGRDLSEEALMHHLHDKLAPLYGLE